MLTEVSVPPKITKEDIVSDLARIYRNFPINYIPHKDRENRKINTVQNFRRFENLKS